MTLKTAQNMGMNYILPENATRFLRPNTGVGEFPFSEKEIRERIETHILIPILPISLMDMIRLPVCKPLADHLYYHGAWWYDEPNMYDLASEPLEARWMLLNRQPVRYVEWDERGGIYEPPFPYNRLRSSHEARGPFEQRLGLRETFYVLALARIFQIPIDIPEEKAGKDYVVLAHADPWHLQSYMLWCLTGNYLINVGGGLPARWPHYSLVEYADADY